MTMLGNDTLELIEPKKPDSQGDGSESGEVDDLNYDPHLQEETLRNWARPRPLPVTPEICPYDDHVDVIGRLNGNGQIPQEISNPVPIGLQRDGDLIFTGAVDVQHIKEARAKVKSLKAALPLHLHLFNSVPAIRCDPNSINTVARENGTTYSNLDGSDVIIGIVDFGCDFRHRNFRLPTGATRILSLWDQSKKNERAPAPAPFNYGREFSSELIDQALAAGDDNAYRVLGYTPPIAAHGTHVMDIAAGNGQEPNLFNGKPGANPPQPSKPGVAPNAQIIFVNLRDYESNFLGNSRCLLDAVAYIFQKADKLGKPAVVNLSLSATGGPHDGTTLVEQGLEALVNAKPGHAIVTSAGNAFTMRSHVTGKARAQKEARILWHTDPRNTAENGIKNEIEIWYPSETPLELFLYPPGSRDYLGPVSLGQTREIIAGGQRLGRVSHRKADPNNGDNHIDIRLPHLEDALKNGQPAPWKIMLKSTGGDVPFHAWIEQSERGLSRFDGKVEQTCTLGSISCGNGTLTVGAFDTAEKAALAPPFEATSAGPIRETAVNAGKGLRAKPEVSAPGLNIVAARAQGGVTALSGTSMAAPHVTGLVALLFQLAQRSGRGLLSFSKTCEILTHGVQRIQPIQLPNPGANEADHDLRLGKGRISGLLAVTELLKKIMTSIPLDLRLSPAKQALQAPNPADVLSFLSTNATVSSANGFKIEDVIGILQEKAQTNEAFRLTIETLN